MSDSTSHIINRLKQQPRHGTANNPLQDYLDLFNRLSDGISDFARSKAFGSISKMMQDLADDVTVLEQRNVSLQKSFNLNIAAAAKLGFELDELSDNFNPLKLREYATELNKLTKGYIGNNNQIFKANSRYLKNYDIMRNQLKLSEDQAVALTKMSAAKRIDLEELARYVKGVEKATEQTGLYTDTLEQLADAGSYISAAYAKAPHKIAKAAQKANLLGISFKDLVATSNKFLDIESSIGAELEMQLLSGKRINSEKFRQAAVEQDMNKMADAMKELMDSMGESALDNVFVMQSLEHTTGLSADTLADVYTQMEANGKLAVDTEKDWGNISNSTEEAAGSVEEFGKAEDKRDTGEQLQDKAQQDYGKAIKETLGDAVNAAKHIKGINDALIKGQDTMIDGVQILIDLLENSNVFKTTMAGAFLYNTLKDTMTGGKGTEMSTTTNLDSNTQNKAGSDVYISPAMGNAIYSSKENTLFSLSPRDEVAAAPGLGSMLNNRGTATQPAFNVYVTNKFELDQLITAVDIRRDERMNG